MNKKQLTKEKNFVRRKVEAEKSMVGDHHGKGEIFQIFLAKSITD